MQPLTQPVYEAPRLASTHFRDSRFWIYCFEVRGTAIPPRRLNTVVGLTLRCSSRSPSRRHQQQVGLVRRIGSSGTSAGFVGGRLGMRREVPLRCDSCLEQARPCRVTA